MTLNAQKSILSGQDDIIIYYPDGAVKIDLDNILTIDKIIYPDMILLKNEGTHFDVIRVLSISDEGGIVYINIEDCKTKREYEISHLFDRTNGYFVWSLLSYPFAMKMFDEEAIIRINSGRELEFDL